MSKRRIVSKLKNISDLAAKDLNFELVDVEFVKEHSNNFLRVYIHKDGGVNLDDCQQMSELLSGKLDKDDPIDETYYLEVSSPGLDRPLKTDKDLKRNIGKELDISLYKALNDMKEIEGTLEEYNKEELIVKIEPDELIKIPRDIIALIKLTVKF